MGAAALPVSDWGRFQDIWNVLVCFGVGTADCEQPVLGADVYSNLLNCAQDTGRSRGALVDVGMGAVSIRLVLVDSLGMGHDHFAFPARAHFPDCSPTGRSGGRRCMGMVRDFVGRGGAHEPVNNFVSASFGILGMVRQT